MAWPGRTPSRSAVWCPRWCGPRPREGKSGMCNQERQTCGCTQKSSARASMEKTGLCTVVASAEPHHLRTPRTNFWRRCARTPDSPQCDRRLGADSLNHDDRHDGRTRGRDPRRRVACGYVRHHGRPRASAAGGLEPVVECRQVCALRSRADWRSGTGATFSVRFPCVTSDLPCEDDDRLPSLTGISILAVDDNTAGTSCSHGSGIWIGSRGG